MIGRFAVVDVREDRQGGLQRGSCPVKIAGGEQLLADLTQRHALSTR
jgi:hypothetical protein